MLRMLETILVTAAGGLLFQMLHVPLPWMLGPLTAVILWTIFTKRRLHWNAGLRNTGLIVLGYGLGLSFTLESARQIGAQLPYMLLGTTLTVGISLVIAYWTAKGAGISYASSAVGNIPGGLSTMVVLSEEIRGADPGVVAFLQTTRLLTVIFIVPFLAVHGLAGEAAPALGGPHASGAAVNAASMLQGTTGSAVSVWFSTLPVTAAWGITVVLSFFAALAARLLKLPTAWFLGPLLFAAIVTVCGIHTPVPPDFLTQAAQWSLGIYLGLGIRLDALSGWKKLLPYSAIGAVIMAGSAWAIAFALSFVHPVTVLTGFLSFSPGGMTEMGVTASMVGADVSLVVAYQIFRILFILFIVPYVLRWMFRERSPKAQAQLQEFKE